MTAPHIGNTGMNDEDPESRRIWVSGYVVRDPCRVVSNYRATRSLDDDLVANGVVGISGIDTRAVTRHLRDRGAMRSGVFSGPDAALAPDEQLAIVRAAPEMAGRNLSAEVSVTEETITPARGDRIGILAMLDLGVKQSTVDNLADRGFDVHVLPQSVTLEQLLAIDPVAVFYSNGPGDPAASDDHVALLRGVLDAGLPFFGICFGNQLLGRALGLGTYKLPVRPPRHQPARARQEHRSRRDHRRTTTGSPSRRRSRAIFDSPNGYGRLEVSHVGLNDNVVEGLRALDIPAFSVQYHPEAAAGPHDANYLFDRFADLVTADHRGEGRRLMPKRDDIQSVLVIGSGPIVIGQAAEFDYSGTQACRVLREEGVRVILVNPNPATIMTDPDFADATYIEPITTEVLDQDHREGAAGRGAAHAGRPDRAERRDRPPRGRHPREVRRRADRREGRGDPEGRGPPAVQGARPRGRGRGRAQPHRAHRRRGGRRRRRPRLPAGRAPVVHDGRARLGLRARRDELIRMVTDGLHQSPTSEVLLEESIPGWKEYELELMRDTADNTVVVCSIENVDPVGVHTGDSITVAPALTLTDREYQRLRDIGIDIIRAVGVDTGGCNIQFAVNPGRRAHHRHRDEPARVAVERPRLEGDRLPDREDRREARDRLPARRDPQRHHRGATPASFEPTLDYVVVKVPRFAFEKFPSADATLTTTMKCVGEAMAIGRNYSTALQKALRSLEKRGTSFHWGDEPRSVAELLEVAEDPDRRPHHHRAAGAAQGRDDRAGVRGDRDRPVVPRPDRADQRGRRRVRGVAEARCRVLPRCAKEHGFSDAQIAQLRGLTEAEVRNVRWQLGVRPVYKTVDTCAGEFPALTPYHYSSYDLETEVAPSDAQEGRHPRLRPEPHRAGRRVRLLLRARVASRCTTPGSRRS